MQRPWFAGRIVAYEAVGWLFIVLLILLDELLDVPYYLFGAEQTPVNWTESVVEITVLSVVWLVIMFTTIRLLNKIRYLEGFLPVCASCKKIRDANGSWSEMEVYIREHTDADFSHSICPECAERLYPELMARNRNSKRRFGSFQVC